MATSFKPEMFPVPESLQTVFGDAQSHAKASLEKGAKLAEEMGEFAKGNVEAILTSSRVAAKGVETIGQDVADYGKRALEHASTAFKGFVAAKSPLELMKLQSDFAKGAVDAAVAEGSRLSETWVKLVGEIAQPLSTRVALAAEKIKAPLAA